ncbi:hypothetical protein F5Y05DRAFT_412334 [Hypoxylon sp. FL0543]|nr:hypothetical protein F5Y05DRAFT_412334 [Hypoxylon sp. FL0543]
MDSEEAYYGIAQADYPRPTINEDVFTWIPLMDFTDTPPLEHDDLTFFNRCLLPNEHWMDASRKNILDNLTYIITACIDLYNDYHTGPMEAGDVYAFFYIVKGYLHHNMPTFCRRGKTPLRLIRMVKYFMKAFVQYNLNAGQTERKPLLIHQDIMTLLFKMDEFNSKYTGAAKIFGNRLEAVSISDGVYYVSERLEA